MAFRSDLLVDWSVSPRIITVAAPSVEVTIQDLYDTCRELEQQIQNNIYPTLISVVKSGGKQPLGGTDQVGITMTLNDARVKFEDRAGPTWVKCEVKGGNLVAIDSVGADMDELEQADYTWVRNTKDVSPALVGISNEIVEGTVTMRQALGLMLAAAAGETSGGGSPPGPFNIRNTLDSLNRISSTYDASGNRLVVTLDLTGLS